MSRDASPGGIAAGSGAALAGKAAERAVRAVKGAAEAALDLAFPRFCAGCGRAVGRESLHICWECLARVWPVQAPHCRTCGNPVSGRVTDEYDCAWCMRRKPSFDRARSAVHYDGVITGIIAAFKYEQAVHLSVDLGMFLVACVRTHYQVGDIDAVLFVPLYHRRERERTYNQAGLLAAEAAAALHRPLVSRCLFRTRDTRSQTELSGNERRENVRGAFCTKNESWIEGRRLLLVDDVMTTGATVDECALVLKQAGAAGVRVATLARGVA